MKWFAEFIVKNAVFANLLALGIMICGGYCLVTLPREATPLIPMHAVQLFAAYPGASAEEIETLIGIPLEAAVISLPDVQHVYITGREGVGQVWVDVDPAAKNPEVSMQRIRAALDQARGLPVDLEPPVILERKVRIPTMVLGVFGGNDEGLLSDVTTFVQRRMQRVVGVEEIDVLGQADHAVYIDVDPAKLSLHNVPLNAVAMAVAPRGQDRPAGSLKIGDRTDLVRAVSSATGVRSLSNIVVKASPEGGIVTVADVANVKEDVTRPPVVTRVDGEEGTLLMIYKSSKGDAVKISKHVRQQMQEIDGTLPENISVKVVDDYAPEVSANLSNLTSNAISGFVLVVMTLWLSLGFWNALWTASGIPVAICGGLIVMKLTDTTFNMMSFMAIIVSLGMIVDDAIVIVENIFTHLQSGANRVQAAVDGVREMILPVTASSLTTCASFAPIMFMSGVFGQFFAIVPIVLIACLLTSLVEAFLVLPSHMADWGSSDEREYKIKVVAQMQRGLVRVETACKFHVTRILRVALRTPGKVVVYAYVLCTVLGVLTYSFKHIVMLNEGDVSVVDVRVTMANDASARATLAVVKDIEKRVQAIGNPDVRAMYSTAGYSRTDMFSITGDHVAMISIRMKEPKEREDVDSGKQLLLDVRKSLNDVVGPKSIEVKHFEFGPPQGAPVAFRVKGSDRRELIETAEGVIQQLVGVPGVVNASHDAGFGKRQIEVVPNDERCALHGVTPIAVAEFLRLAINETPVARSSRGGTEVKIIVRLDPERLRSVDSLSNLRILTPLGADVALSELAEFRTPTRTPKRSAWTVRRW